MRYRYGTRWWRKLQYVTKLLATINGHHEWMVVVGRR